LTHASTPKKMASAVQRPRILLLAGFAQLQMWLGSETDWQKKG
jgi:hypothetical protein